MTASKVVACILNITFLLLLVQSTKIDGDFAFDTDVVNESWLNILNVDWNSHKLMSTAYIGRVFYLMLSNEERSFDSHWKLHHEFILHDESPLPAWLIYNKNQRFLWGIPLEDDKGNLTLIFKNAQEKVTKKLVINVVPLSNGIEVDHCSSNEDSLTLTLLIDKNVKDIIPKQRVVAVRDFSLFLGIPYSAFTLRTESNSDNITDDSIEFAGPGDSYSQSSSHSALDIFLQCGTTLNKETKGLIHTLKQQAEDGTISEVLRLPLIAWRIRSNDNLNTRNRRQAEDSGSGDYDEDYYDDYKDGLEYDDTDEDEIPEPTTTKKAITINKTPTIVSSTQPSTLTSEVPESSSTHAHRHHHGETMDILPSWPISNNSIEAVSNFLPPVATSNKIPELTTVSTTFVTKKTSGVESSSQNTFLSTSTLSSTSKKISVNMDKNVATPTTTPVDDTDDNYDNIDDYVDEYDDNESQTIVPANETPSITQKSTSIKIPVETTTAEEATKEITKLRELTEVPTTEIVNIKKLDQDIEIETEPTTKENIDEIINEITTTLPVVTSQITPQVTTVTQATLASSTSISSTTSSQEDIFTIEDTTLTKITTQKDAYTEASSTVSVSYSTIKTTEKTEYESVKNFPPYIENRLKRKYVVAGKVFRFVIPENTFKDLEDGYNLKIEFLDAEENPIKFSSWCQYDPIKREVYGLPLEEDVSKWEYVIRATDKDGTSVQDRLTILVQQHKLQRVFNHEFTLEMRIEKHNAFKHLVDWSLRTLQSLEKIYNTNVSEITVLKMNYSLHSINFVWTNNSLPTHYCPKKGIEDLFKILTSNDNGDPSRELNVALAPELKAKKLSYRGLGVCLEINTPIAPPVNYPPILRNPVDHINATVGELLVFKVPKDTFYDPEDVDALSLNISLLTSDRQHIPAHNWLQFDSKNREFYGIPTKHGRNEYQLICVDSGGLSVIDSLEVVVHDHPKVVYNIEFSMTVELAYDTFTKSAKLQRKFAEKLMEIFGDKDASNIIFGPFKQRQHSTIITWFNKTLPTDKCAHEEINKLESLIKNNERGIADHVHLIMEPDFLISTIKILPINNCKTKPRYHTPKMDEVPKLIPKYDTKHTETSKNYSVIPKYDDRIEVDDASFSSSQDQYVLTYLIPIALIFVMFFVAVTAACILYRRRRTGKMNVLEEGRHNFGNKGIPVIFQEELEEKPESGTKVPVILKDEKPPLAPPEYSKSGSLTLNDDSEPYHPPPPFTKPQDNGKNWRPKPTPTYRKPPPYVPP